MNKKTISLVVPCYNEEKNIKLFYDSVIESFKKTKYNVEIVFVNDGSIDNTLYELKKIIKTNKYNIKVINFSRNFGKEAAIYAGLKRTVGDYVVLIDADLQQPPRLILKMLELIEKNDSIDIVAYYQEKRIEGKLLTFLKKTFYNVISRLTGLKFVNGASDFRLMKKNVVNAIIKICEHDRFSKGIFAWIGFETYYIPYIPEERANGITSWNFKKLFKYAFSGIISFAQNPLKFIISFGVFVSVLAIFWIILLFLLGIRNQLMYALSIIFFMFGINFMLLGWIGIFINRIYNETRNRPIYVEKEVLTNEENN